MAAFHLLTLIVALALTGLVAGCGGDSDDEPSAADYQVKASTTVTAATPPLTKSQFVEQANAICREAWRTIRENWGDYTDTQEQTGTESARFKEAVRASLLAGIVFHIFDGVQDLGSPPGEARRIERVIGALQRTAELGWRGYWSAGNAAEVVARFATYNRLAGNYGLADCRVTPARLRGLQA